MQFFMIFFDKGSSSASRSVDSEFGHVTYTEGSQAARETQREFEYKVCSGECDLLTSMSVT
jgi:hypothetical protein